MKKLFLLFVILISSLVFSSTLTTAAVCDPLFQYKTCGWSDTYSRCDLFNTYGGQVSASQLYVCDGLQARDCRISCDGTRQSCTASNLTKTNNAVGCDVYNCCNEKTSCNAITGACENLPTTTKTGCNYAGGIWCDGEAKCVEKNKELISQDYTNIVCTVTSQQMIYESRDSQFNFQKLELKKDASLHFVDDSGNSLDLSSLTSSNPSFKIPKGGMYGLSGETSGCGRAGASGSLGGNLGSVSLDGDSCGNPGGSGAAGQKILGGFVKLKSKELILDGQLSVDGVRGNDGFSGTADDCGVGGGGGSGGSGAGILFLYYDTVSSPSETGKITAIGGFGGSGGPFKGDNNNICNANKDVGGGGGAGGGGAGGLVFLSSPLPKKIIPSCDGGDGGIGGCVDRGGYKENGKNGFKGEDGSSCGVLMNNPEDCNNGIDDNGYNGIDMDDPYCHNNAKWNFSAKIKSEFVSKNKYTRSSFEGFDAACGDDFSVVTDYCLTKSCSDISYQNCPLVPGCMQMTFNGVPPWSNPSYLCTGVPSSNSCEDFGIESCSAQEYCYVNPLANYFADYGFMDPSKNFLCYNYASDLKLTFNDVKKSDAVWDWLEAKKGSNAFKVFTLDNSFDGTAVSDGKTTDVISNGNEWFYCNANSLTNSGLSGNPVGNLKTFDNYVASGHVKCSSIMSALYPSEPKFEDSCSSDSPKSCCLVNPVTNLPQSIDVTQNPVDIGSCECIDSRGEIRVPSNPDCDTLNPLSAEYSLFCNRWGQGQPDQDKDKTVCGYDGSSCIEDDFSTLDCEEDIKGIACSKDKYCSNGIRVNTYDKKDKTCCYSPQETQSCNARPATLTPESCASVLHGYVYNSLSESCSGDNVLISGTQFCCMNEPVPLSGYFGEYSWFSKITNTSYVCFAHDNENIFASCVYDANSLSRSFSKFGNYVDSSNLRSASMGSRLHVIRNYDKYDSNKNLVIDNIRSVVFTSGKTNPSNFNPTSPDIVYDLRQFKYLEFDVLYPEILKDHTVTLVVTDSPSSTKREFLALGITSSFSTNGDAPRRWHHIIIDLTNYPSLKANPYYVSLEFTTLKKTTSPPSMLIDSITLNSPINPQGQIINSENLYCTGGFGSWISDLDAPLGTDFANPQSYGPYKFACEAQAPYDWTGTMCCGDDTKNTLDAEFYTDKDKGCFAGLKIENNWAVSHIYNVKEIRTEEFNNYYYRDLLYYDNEFVGCQIGDKYDSLKESPQVTLQNNNLVDSKINEQCAVKGDYYCANGAWRQLIQTEDSVQGKNFKSVALQLKTTPPGVELIKNGFKEQPKKETHLEQ